MHHLKASNLLTHYLAGELEAVRREEVEEHLADCAECAGWVATYSLFAETPGEHLSSAEIARLALQPETLDRSTSERCAAHLERCRGCREEVELVREATAEARQEAEPAGERNPAGLPLRWAVLAAAAMVLLALGAILAPGTADRSPIEVLLTGRTLHGEETIQADTIFVGTTEVAPGSALRLESAAVAFGDGFSVKTGGSLVVVTGGPADDEDSSESS